jgi:transcriptional regulator with XRE-family HTH domain
MSQERDDLAARIGSNLKELRTAMGLSPKRLAEETKLSPAFFSRLEKGSVMPSIPTLQIIADALKVDIEQFFGRGEEKGYVINRAEKRRFVRPKGKPYHVALLAENMENPFMEPFLCALPRKDKDGETEFTTHEGQEFCYVVEGSMELTLGDQKFTLKKGDAAYWNGIIPHKGTGVGKEPAIALNVHLIPGKRRRVRSREGEAKGL